MDINRKMKNGYRRLLSVFVALCLTVGLVPLMSVPVLANVITALTFAIGSPQSGAGYEWDNTTRTLTLTNFTQNLSTSTNTPIGITLPAGSTIILEGTNTITGNINSNYTSDSNGILANGDLTIGGTGTLNVSSSRSNNASSRPIQVSGILTINSGIINATGNSGRANVGIAATRGIIINGGTTTTIAANSTSGASNGMTSGEGAVIINGGTVIATGGTTSTGTASRGIWGEEININGGSVTAMGHSVAFNQAPNIPTLFTAWASTNNADPGGDGSTSYTHNAGNRFVRIVSRHGITYNGNGSMGGAVPVDGDTHLYSSPVTILDVGTLEREGYRFAGWNTEADGSGTAVSAGSTFTITSDTTLYAQWRVILPYSATIRSTGDFDDVYVQARIVDGRTPVYKIDIAWGDMKFIFTAEASEWNPDTREIDVIAEAGWSGFEDGNNQIVVSNHSNADVRVSFSVTNIELAPNVDMDVLQTNDEDGDAAVDMPLGRVPLPNEDAPNIEVYLWLSGEPSATKIEGMKDNDAWSKVGIITVTITPDGDVLTPLR